VFPPDAATPAQVARVREVAALLGAEHLLRRSVLELSRGEGRRVLLARALAPGPALLVLDEPCEGLDARSREAFLHHVSAVLRRGTAVVLATHREEELVPEISRVAEVREGRVSVREREREPGERERERERERVRVHVHDHDHDHLSGVAPLLFDARQVTVLVDGRAVLSDLDFTLRRGERVAVLGANGAGKSTFLRLLAGDEQPARGRIGRLDLGEQASAFDLRGRIGLVSPELQARHRFDATGEAVVLSGFQGTIGLAEAPTEAPSPAPLRGADAVRGQTPSPAPLRGADAVRGQAPSPAPLRGADAVRGPEARARARETLARLGIAHLAARHLLTLSYGELRRLLLARALAPAPEVLLLDEPLAGLDPAARAWVIGTVAQACDAGAALVAVTHHQDDLPPGISRVLSLEGGRLRGPRISFRPGSLAG
jgi:molybdate transport system ATP-binding protein